MSCHTIESSNAPETYNQLKRPIYITFTPKALSIVVVRYLGFGDLPSDNCIVWI